MNLIFPVNFNAWQSLSEHVAWRQCQPGICEIFHERVAIFWMGMDRALCRVDFAENHHIPRLFIFPARTPSATPVARGWPIPRTQLLWREGVARDDGS
jgi:hypothetical protein